MMFIFSVFLVIIELINRNMIETLLPIIGFKRENIKFRPIFEMTPNIKLMVFILLF